MNFLTEKVKMHRDNQVINCWDNNIISPLPTISMLLLSYEGKKQLKISSNIAQGRRGVICFKITTKMWEVS